MGCGFGKLAFESKFNFLVKCIVNERDVKDVMKAYENGPLCSKCSDYNETCDAKLKGLCVPISIKEIEKTTETPNMIDENDNEEFDEDDNDYESVPGNKITNNTKTAIAPNITTTVDSHSAQSLEHTDTKDKNAGDFRYSVLFWCLYSFLAFAVFITCCITIYTARKRTTTYCSSPVRLDNW